MVVSVFIMGLLLMQLIDCDADLGTKSAGMSYGFTVYPCMVFGFLPTSLYSYDERSGWSRYSAALPYKRSQYVNVKMLMGLAFGVLYIVVNVLIHLYLWKVNPTYDSHMFMKVIGADIIFSFLFTAINVPVTFRFGHKAGTGVFIAQCGLMGFMTGVMEAMIEDSGLDLTAEMVIIACVISVVLYAVSWLLSVRFYERREI